MFKWSFEKVLSPILLIYNYFTKKHSTKHEYIVEETYLY